MNLKRRSFLAALAGLPLVGRLFAKPPIEQSITFPSPEPMECTITHATIFSEAGEVTIPLSTPLRVSECTMPSFAREDEMLAAIFKDMDLTRGDPPIVGDYANYAREAEPRSAEGWDVGGK